MEKQSFLGRLKMNFSKLRAGKRGVPTLKSEQTARRLSQREIETALQNNDLPTLRNYSEAFYRTYGIYRRLVHYQSEILLFPHLVIPRVTSESSMEQMSEALDEVLEYTRKASIVDTSYQIALAIVKDGVFYGYEVENADGNYSLMKFDPSFCRSRFKINGVYEVEFNVEFFNGIIDKDEREEILEGYPQEISKAYNAFVTDSSKNSKWVALDPTRARAHMLGNQAPLFSSVFSDLLELSDYKNLDMDKAERDLYTLLIQKIPVDKEGNIALYEEEIESLHNNARQIIGSDFIDVLTTPCDIEAVDTKVSDRNRVEKDNVDKATNMVYTSAGAPIALFNAGNAPGSVGLSLSTKVDESLMFPLLTQFARWYENRVQEFSSLVEFSIIFPPVSIFNQSDMVEEYKGAASFGFPTKLLTMVALGVPQYDITSLLDYENVLLGLPERMVPVQSTHTKGAGEDKGGRPESDGPLGEEGERARDEETNENRAEV